VDSSREEPGSGSIGDRFHNLGPSRRAAARWRALPLLGSAKPALRRGVEPSDGVAVFISRSSLSLFRGSPFDTASQRPDDAAIGSGKPNIGSRLVLVLQNLTVRKNF
jgi:hypothetical protein